MKNFLYLRLIPSSHQDRGLYSVRLLEHGRSILLQFVQGLGEMTNLHAQGHSKSYESLWVQLSQGKQQILCGEKMDWEYKSSLKKKLVSCVLTAWGSGERVAASSVFYIQMVKVWKWTDYSWKSKSKASEDGISCDWRWKCWCAGEQVSVIAWRMAFLRGDVVSV